jgi:hypothetical protein
MFEEAIAQKSLEKSLNKTIVELHAKVEEQAKEVNLWISLHLRNLYFFHNQIGQMAHEANAQKALDKMRLQTINELKQAPIVDLEKKVSANIYLLLFAFCFKF